MEAPVAYLRYYHGIYLEEMKKTTKILSQDSGVSAEIQTGILPNTCQKHYHLIELQPWQNLPFCYYT